MIKMKFAFLAIVLLKCVTVFSQTSGTLTGMWNTADGQARIHIMAVKNGTFEGVLSKYAPAKEGFMHIHLPTEFLGVKILKNIKPVGADKWSGIVYNPSDRKEYACNIRMVDPNKIKIRGFIGFSLIGKTEYWTRSVK